LEHVTAENSVGKVINAWWDPENKAVWYEAEIYDDEVQNKIRKGLIQHVSVGADYERIDVLDGKVPHGLHNAELSLVAVPGIPQTNIQIMEKLAKESKSLPLKAAALVNNFRLEGREYITPGEYILGFHRDPYAFLPEHFNTVWLDRENGVLAIVGRLRAEPEKRRIQAILFSKAKMWDENKIRDWFLMHPHYLIEKAAEGLGSPASLPLKQPRKAKEMSEQNDIRHEEKPKCPPGQVWDEEQQKCVPESEVEQPQLQERVWTRRYINDLPDSAFAVILPGGEKDKEGKTSPRNLRKFPHHDAKGRIDLPHLRNANARVPQSDIPQEYKEKAMRHLAAHKKKLGIGLAAEEAKLLEQAEDEEAEEVEFEVAPEPTMDELIQSIEDIVSQINEAIESIKARLEKLEKTVQRTETGGVAEKLLKNPKEAMIPVKEAIEMIESVLPSSMVERSWSLGPQRLCQELRGVVLKLRRRLEKNE